MAACGRARICWVLLATLPLAACGPSVVAGDANTVTIQAGPLGNVEAFAQDYCGEFDKRAEPLGGGYLGPDTTKRIYAYNCVAD